MATMTIEYDARNSFAKNMVLLLLESGIIKEKKRHNREAAKIADICMSLKKGKVKTRPISNLLKEL